MEEIFGGADEDVGWVSSVGSPAGTDSVTCSTEAMGSFPGAVGGASFAGAMPSAARKSLLRSSASTGCDE